MKAKWILGAVIAASIAAPAFAQVRVYLGAPPALRYERRTPPPGEGFYWIDGYWGNNGRNYNWVPGRWERPPYAGAYYTHPHYDHYDRGWEMHEGHWDHDDHHDHDHDWGRR